tara:strand:+ start:9195 stop:9401 length:207 start_codon:yes stop_codon:yes gene_type:complete
MFDDLTVDLSGITGKHLAFFFIVFVFVVLAFLKSVVLGGLILSSLLVLLFWVFLSTHDVVILVSPKKE